MSDFNAYFANPAVAYKLLKCVLAQKGVLFVPHGAVADINTRIEVVEFPLGGDTQLRLVRREDA